jgi:hypothetical protein
MQQAEQRLIPITFTHTELFAVSVAITRYQTFLTQTEGDFQETVALLEHLQQEMIFQSLTRTFQSPTRRSSSATSLFQR